MRKALALAALLFASHSFAENTLALTSGDNLNKMLFCIDPFNIRVADVYQDNAARDYAKAQYEILKTKLSAYRIPYVSECRPGTTLANIWANFEGSSPISTNNARSYNIELIITIDNSDFKIAVVPYAVSARGVAVNYSVSEMNKSNAEEWSKLIDRFAADYAKANP